MKPTERNELTVYSVMPPVMTMRPLAGRGSPERLKLERLASAREFGPGEIIFRAGDRPAKVWIVLSGKARMLMDGLAPSRRITAGSVVGLTEVFAGIPFRATLTAESRCISGSVGYKQLTGFLRDEPSFCLELMESLARDLYRGHKKLLSMT